MTTHIPENSADKAYKKINDEYTKHMDDELDISIYW